MKIDIPEVVLAAIVRVESGGRLSAMRYEPHYRWLWDVKLNKPFKNGTSLANFPYIPEVSSRETELVGQRISWGPMQVMGAVARELGFRGGFPELCSPLGIEYGSRLLMLLKKRHYETYGWPGVIAAYNAGTPYATNDGKFMNQEYVDRVLSAIPDATNP